MLIKYAFAETQKAIGATTVEKGHGRIEKRTCKIITDMVWINKKENWRNLQTIISIETKRTILRSNQIHTEQRFYITSLLATSSRLNEMVRGIGI